MNQNKQYTNPWLDIASYTIHDANRFKGREKAIVKFSGVMGNGIMSVLYASSGIGKTSFLNAGIDPLLIQQGYYPVHILFPDDIFHVGEHVEKWLIQRIQEKTVDFGYWEDKLQISEFEKEQANSSLQTCETSLWWWLHTKQLVSDETKQAVKLLLVFDQFEEVFVKSRKVDKGNLLPQNLFRTIEELSNSSLPLGIAKVIEEMAKTGVFLDLDNSAQYKVIFSLRKEYLSDFDYWTQDRYSIAELLQNRMLLLPLTVKQAKRVITEQPDEETGEGYVKTLHDVQDEIIEKLNSHHHNEIEPFLLSVLCSRLYDMARQAGQAMISTDDLRLYDVDTIIQSFYEEKISAIIAKPRHLYQFEKALVDDEGGRNRIKVKELRSIGFEKNYQEELLQSHLIRIDTFNSDDKYVELIHDRIADAIMQKRLSKKRQNTRVLKIILAILLFIGFIGITIKLSITNPNSKVAYIPHKVVIDGRGKDSGGATSYLKHYNNHPNIKSVIIKSEIGRSTQWLPSFKSCANLEYVEFRDGEYDIPANMFKNCTSLNRIVTKDATINSIGEDAFMGCENLSMIDLSKTIHIGKSAFQDCSSLKTIQFADDLKNVPECGFSNTGLSNVALGSAISRIDNSAFYPSAKSIHFNTDENPYYTYYDGILIDKRDTSIVYLYTDSLKKPKEYYVAFPAILDKNKTYLYKYRINKWKWNTILIKDISKQLNNPLENTRKTDIDRGIYGDTLKIIDNYIYKSDSYTKTIQEENIHILDLSQCLNVTIFGDAFAYCNSLYEIIWPSEVKSIEKGAFRNCANLRKLLLQNVTVSSIQEEAFAYCNSLSTVYLPEGSLSNNIFVGDTIDTLFYSSKVQRFDNVVIKNAIIPNSIPTKNVTLGHLPNTHFHIPDSSIFFFDRSNILWALRDTLMQFIAYGADVHNLHYDSIYSQYSPIIVGKEYDKHTEISNEVLCIGHEIIGLPIDKKYNISDKWFSPAVIGYRDILNVEVGEAYYYDVYKGFMFPITAAIGRDGVDKADMNKYNYIWQLKQDSVIYISPFFDETICQWAFNQQHIRQIHIPFTSPTISLELPDSLMKKITIYVPHGTEGRYLEDWRYKKFKEIKEDPQWRQYFNVFYYYYKGAAYFFRAFMPLLYILIGCITLFALSIMIVTVKKQQQKITLKKILKTLLATLGLSLLTLLIWVTVYYFVWLALGTFNQILASILASTACLLYIIVLIKWINQNNIFDMDAYKESLKNLIAYIIN